jgi:hypothetical protein
MVNVQMAEHAQVDAEYDSVGKGKRCDENYVEIERDFGTFLHEALCNRSWEGRTAEDLQHEETSSCCS